jgi:(Z)-2-((N-methylformamido)methylene)-5-hydroxybutyrolactone dehydrogenase
VSSLKRYQHYIGGDWREPSEGAYLPSYNPATGQPWYELACGSAEDVDRAVTAAHESLSTHAWRELTQTRRGALLRRLGALIDDNVEALARIESQDNGKPLREVRAQLAGLSEYYYYFGGLADKIEGRVIPGVSRAILNYTVRGPIGVVAAIAPWNSPLTLASLKLAPALAGGNAVVVKPSEHASASILELMSLIEAAGFPAGVVNVVTGVGDDTGRKLVSHPLVAKVAFTGGTAAGRAVGALAGGRLALITLELGGKSPQIVFSDADLESAARGIVSGIFLSAGQTCVAGARVFVHADVHDEVRDRLLARAAAIRIGDPLLEETQLGPLGTKQQLEKVEQYSRLGQEEGATLVYGGRRPPGLSDGWYFEPTIFTEVTNAMRVAREEIFGPIASLILFRTEAEAVALANATDYGLAAGVWTRDLARAHRVAGAMEAGTVYVNTYRSMAPMSPLGGFKQSGVGQENGLGMIHEYTLEKSVWVNVGDEPGPEPFGG